MIKFGTSGFRGVIGDNWTKGNIQKIAFALRQMIKAEGHNVNIIVGYDNRFMGRHSAEWFCEAVACEYIKATVYEISVPTPLIAFKAVTFDFGIMFTASHNPHYYNGIKVFIHGGKEADDVFFGKISKNIESPKKFDSAGFKELVLKGFIELTSDAGDYADRVISLVNTKKIKASEVKVLFNPMHGSGSAICKDIFKRLGISYTIINENPDPYFGGSVPAPYPYRLVETSKMVVKGKYSFGFALDGDGDRVAFIDSDGKFYDCNYLMAAFYYYYIEIKKRKGTMAKNFPSSSLATKLCKKYGYQIVETRPGFKFLGPVLERDDVLLAGESAGIAFKEMSLCKDGIFAAFALIDIMANTKKSIGKIIEEIIDLVNFPTFYLEYAYIFEDNRRQTLEKLLTGRTLPDFGHDVMRADFYPDGFKAIFDDEYWCSARASGTENAIRFYTEMPTEADAKAIIKKLEQFYNLTERQK